MSKPVLYLFNGKVASFGNAVFGFTQAEVYTVTISTVSHGTITASPVSGVAGTTITLSSTPDSGYELDYFTVNGVAIVGNSFTMPAENVTVGAVFVEESPTFDQVTIGTQTWMSKNLAIDDGEGGIYTQTVNYGQGDVVEYYYTWNAAVRVAASISGWHLPTRGEFDALATYIGSAPGKKLKSTYGWKENSNGTDVFRFTGLPAGIYSPSYSGSGAEARFWSSSQSVDYENLAYFTRLYFGDSYFQNMTDNKTEFYSVRLIKDS